MTEQANAPAERSIRPNTLAWRTRLSSHRRVTGMARRLTPAVGMLALGASVVTCLAALASLVDAALSTTYPAFADLRRVSGAAGYRTLLAVSLLAPACFAVLNYIVMAAVMQYMSVPVRATKYIRIAIRVAAALPTLVIGHGIVLLLARISRPTVDQPITLFVFALLVLLLACLPTALQVALDILDSMDLAPFAEARYLGFSPSRAAAVAILPKMRLSLRGGIVLSASRCVVELMAPLALVRGRESTALMPELPDLFDSILGAYSSLDIRHNLPILALLVLLAVASRLWLTIPAIRAAQ